MQTSDRDRASAANKRSGITLLGQGGFGCVYYRGFSPNGAMLSGEYITKITRREKSREVRIGKLVSKLPRYGEFFAVVLKVENVELASVDDAEHLLAKCDIVKKQNNGPDEKFQLLTQMYVPGVMFVELASMPKYGSSFSNLLNVLISCREHLLLGIARLQTEARIVHFDIKAENVVFNTLAKNPVIIDFGLSFVMDDVVRALSDGGYVDDYDRVAVLRQFFYGFFPDYSAWPVEVHIVCWIVAETGSRAYDPNPNPNPGADGGRRAVAVLSAEALQSLISAYISGHAFIKYQPEAYKTACYERFMARYTQSAVGRPGLDVIREYVKHDAWKQWDLYAVSVMFLDVLEIARHRLGSFPAEYAAHTDAFSKSLQLAAGFI